MNFELFDKLRSRLAVLKPKEFDYCLGSLNGDGCGCVGAHLVAMISFRLIVPTDGAWAALILRLGVTKDEADYIYVPIAHDTPDDMRTRGWLGIREALRRLDLVASRYTRPTISTDLETTKAADRERAFLLSAMEAASQPLEVG